MDIFLYNTLSRKKEKFEPIIAGEAGVYTCGPTVYNFAHLGNLRSYLFEDFLVRTLAYNDYKIKRVMNITDVGHLTGDMDMGEDKLENASAKEGRSAWEIAAYYADAFKEDLKFLNILPPDIWCRATDHIKEQIELAKTLEEKGYLYKTKDGLYFDTAKFPDYNKLSHLPLEELKEGARIEKNPEKKNPTDFAVWKFSPENSQRQMEWQSPWGLGFPGWHLECSAMSMKYLAGELDIHCGGVDHINVHHTNEIAQSEAASGKKFFNYWLHGAFLNISGGKKMAKSGNNFLTIENALIKKGLSPLAYRFAALQVHYRKPMEYSEANLRQAQSALESLYKQIASLPEREGSVDVKYKEKFLSTINDDLNMPQALALLFQVLKSELSPEDKKATILDFDKVLGLSLKEAKSDELDLNDLPDNVKALLEKREEAREKKDYQTADNLREDLKVLGYLVEDGPQGQTLKTL